METPFWDLKLNPITMKREQSYGINISAGCGYRRKGLDVKTINRRGYNEVVNQKYRYKIGLM